MSMFERFTAEARRVVVLAQEEARELRHRNIGTDHMLLGLLGVREGIAARALGALVVDHESALAEVAGTAGRRKRLFKPQGHIPFTTETRKALEESLREAIRLGHHHIGTEHLLLGLLRPKHGAAVSVLSGLGAPPELVRQQVHLTLNVQPDTTWT
nr:Clp protease N-terminal domain-containing protein [Nocardiopsis halotolerans]